MIIVERHYDTKNPSGGRMVHNICRKVFGDNDVEGIQKFLDEKHIVSGYEWYNLDFKYIKI